MPNVSLVSTYLKFERILESVRGDAAVESLISHPFFLVNATAPDCGCAEVNVRSAAAIVQPGIDTVMTGSSYLRTFYKVSLKQ